MEKTGLLRIFITLLFLLLLCPGVYSRTAQEAAQAVVDHMRSKKFEKDFTKDLDKAQRHLDTHKQTTDAKVKENIQTLAPTINESKKIIEQTVQNNAPRPKEELLIFLSESMPDHEIWRFLAGGSKLMRFKNVKFIMYGIPQEGVIDRYAEKHQQNILLSIDPFLFEAHKIVTVPVVILGEYRINAPLNLSEALDLIGQAAGIDISEMKYELQLP
jgi:hypothetical protein